MELPKGGHGRPTFRPSEPSLAPKPQPPPAAWYRLAWRGVARLVNGLFAHNAFEAASSIAFWFFLSLVPLLVFVGWLLGHFVRTKGVDSLVEPFLEIVPGTDAGNLLKQELERMAGALSAPIGPIAVMGFLWSSSSGLHNLMDVFEIAVKCPQRPWWKQRLIALVWVVVGLGTTVGTIWSLVQLDTFVHHDDIAAVESVPDEEPSAAPPSPRERHRQADKPTGNREIARTTRFRSRFAQILHTPWERTFGAAVVLGMGMSMLAAFYRFAVEHPTGVRRRAWPGAITAVGLWLLMSWGFGEYASSLADYAVYYGSLAAVAVLLLWLYLSSLMLVIGAEVNAQLEGVRD